jgi:hypothetical protein
MIRKLFAAFLMVGVSVALAKDSAPSPGAPAKPAAGKSSPAKADAPATKPAPKPAPQAKAAGEHFPTPAEILEKMKQRKSETDKLLKVAHFDLSQPILEKSPDFTLLAIRS